MILVVGATGMLGGKIVRHLLARGEDVRALVRDASGDESLREAGAETVFGDLKEPASLRAACQGAFALITTANSAGRGGDDNVETVDLEGNRSLVDAATASGVDQFIFVSAQGEDPDSRVPFLRAKGLTSKRLRESGMTYTILMPDLYMDVWIPLVVFAPLASGQPITIVGEGTREHYPVAVDDVAGFAVAAVGNDAARNRDLLIGGPQPRSWRDVISTLENVNGVSVEVRSLPPGAPMPGFPDAASGFMASLETYDSPAPIPAQEAENVFDVHLTTLEVFLRQHPVAA